MNFDALIVGLGNIGLGYDLASDTANTIKTHARAFHLHDRFNLKGGVDCNQAARRSFQAHYDRNAYEDLETALSNTTPHVIVVASPTDSHLEDVRTIVRHAAPRAIVCEKPLSLNLREAAEIVALCNAHHIDLYVNFIRRADPAVLEIGHRFDSGRISKPVKGVVWYSKGFVHNCSHFFDLMSFWLGEPRSHCVISPGRLLPSGDRTPDVQVTFAGGSIVFLAVEEDFCAHSAAEFLSASGRLAYELGGNHVIWYPAPGEGSDRNAGKAHPDPEPIDSGLARYQFHVADHLASALDNKANNLCSGEDALKILEFMSSINEASSR